MTLIGKEDSCQIRLNVDGIAPFHCALIQAPQGLFLRDLPGNSGTLVNGEPADNRVLRHDDLITVGPFRFRVRLPKALANAKTNAQLARAKPDAVQREKDALRIQAAAVAAQQAALMEEEVRLQQRRVALEKQEKQLAGHLEDKRRQLVLLHRQTRQERTELQAQRQSYEQRLGTATSDLTKERRELADVWEQNQTMRKRLVNLHRKLRQRWHRHWMAERQAQQRQGEELARQRQALEKEAEHLQQEREAVDQLRLRVNGECELSRRQLKAAWKEFRQIEKQWQEAQAREKRESREKERQLGQRKAELARAERTLEDEKQSWQAKRLYLEKENEGLENRIRNHRRKILDQEQEVVRLDGVIRVRLAAASQQGSEAIPALASESVPTPTSNAADSPPGSASDQTNPELAGHENQLRLAEKEIHQRLDTLEKLAGELADQRLHVTEQWERLLQARQTWEKDQEAAAADLEGVTLRLQKQEQVLLARENTLASGECTLRQRLSEILQLRHNLEGCQVRLRTRVKAWEADRDRLVTELRAREKLVERRLGTIESLRTRWEKRRRQELKRLQAHLVAAEKVRHDYTAIREEWLRRKDDLEKQEIELAEKNLALEQYRQECVPQAADSAAVEKRLERLRRRWAALSLNAERNLAQNRQALLAELHHLDERHQELHLHAQKVAAQEVKLANLHTTWEKDQGRFKDKYDQMRQQLQILVAQRHRYESQIADLREEVERVAQLLLDEHDSAKVQKDKAQAPAIVQAA
jgi:pSer/pThr/pTyr-binding forkhead associated (FHA) protein